MLLEKIGTFLYTTLTYSPSIAIGIIGIGFLIGFHELGHFLFCKLFGIKTPSFSIGMGPSLFKKKIGDTEFNLSLIPLGGYVEIAGAAEVGQGEQKEAYSTASHSFRAKPYWQKFLVMMGGIIFNIFFAYCALSLLFFIGVPKHPLLMVHAATTEISAVQPGSPAQTAGLLAGDTIIAINTVPVRDSFKTLTNLIGKNPDSIITLAVERNGQEVPSVSVTLGSKEVGTQKIGYLGTEFNTPRASFTTALRLGYSATKDLAYVIVISLKNIFAKREFSSVGGPLMVLKETVKGANKGIKIFLFLLSFISINLALLNLIPLPILDGGQLLLYTIEALFKRPLPDTIREYIFIITWILMLALMLFLSVRDLFSFFH